MTELIFLKYGVKCQKVWKTLLLLSPEDDERKKHMVTHAVGLMRTMHINGNYKLKRLGVRFKGG